MADVHSKEIRSLNMSKIKSRNTRPELIVRKYLFSKGLRYRLYVRSMPGKPDIVLHRFNTVVFVHGCFWHGHTDCKHFTLPKTRTQWWLNKIDRNRANDARVVNTLRSMEWNVRVIWECQTKNMELRQNFLEKLVRSIRNQNIA